MISVLRVYYYLIWPKFNVFLHSKQPVYNLIGYYSLKLLLSFADNSIIDFDIVASDEANEGGTIL